MGNLLDAPIGMALGPSGEVYVSGSNSDNVFKIGIVEQATVLGRALLVKDPKFAGNPGGTDPDMRGVTVLAKESNSPDGIIGDPLLNGATITLIANGTMPSQQTIVIPPGEKAAGPNHGWKRIKGGFVSGGFKWANPTATGTAGIPIKTALIKRTGGGTFLLKVSLKGSLTGDVDIEPPKPGTDGGLIFEINGDDGWTYCVTFGGAAGGEVSNLPTSGATQFAKTFKVVSPTTEAGCPAP
jgi:hypothetical protein